MNNVKIAVVLSVLIVGGLAVRTAGAKTRGWLSSLTGTVGQIRRSGSTGSGSGTRVETTPEPNPWEEFSYNASDLTVDEARWLLVWLAWDMPTHLFDKTAIARAGAAEDVDRALDNTTPVGVAAASDMSVQDVLTSVIMNQDFTQNRTPSAEMYLLSVIEEAAGWITETPGPGWGGGCGRFGNVLSSSLKTRFVPLNVRTC